MQSALFLIGIFPPPSSGTNIFTRLYGSRTWLTTDAWETFVVEFIIRHLMLFNIIPHFLF